MADENNIGSSRLIGTNNVDQAVSALSTQINKLAGDISKLSSSFDKLVSSSNRSAGSSSGSNWNAGSNRSSYASNGGGGTFSGRGTFSQLMANRLGGGPAGGAKIMAVGGVVAGAASALTQYGNKNMSSNMQMDYFGTQSAIAGGFSGGAQGPRNLAMQQGFARQYGALSVNDAAQAGYTNSYTFGNSQFNGVANRSYTAGQIQVGSFAYANPTLGAATAATAAQQTYTARSLYMSQALGLASPIGAGGVKNSMSNIAQSMLSQTFGNQRISNKQFNAASQQGGSLAVNMQYWGQQLGWDQNTIQEYQGILQGQVAAQNKGMSSSKYYNLLGKAQGGDKSAQGQLSRTTGMGSSMFEAQRNLNSTRMTRQEDITQSLAPAFDKATNVVNDFSSALTALMKNTGLDKLVGTGAGWGSAVSGGLSGLSGGFGTIAGAYGAARLFSGTTRLFGTAASAGGGFAGSAAAGADGAYTITTLGAASTASGAGSLIGAGAVAAPVAGAAAGFVIGADWLGNKMLSNQHGVPIPSNYTQADFNAYKKQKLMVASQMRGAWNSPGEAAGWERAYFKANPAGSGGKNPVGPGRYGGGSSGVVGNTPGNGSKNVGANAASVIHAAETQLGVPYVWGGEMPGRGMDCSGLTQWAYGKAGVKIPRVAADQQKAGTPVATNKTQPGDLLFVGNPAHHVVMSIGGGKVIEAPHTGESVRIRPFSPSEFTSATRIVGSVGDMSSLSNGASNTNTLSTSQQRSGGDIGAYGGTSELEALTSALAGGAGGTMPLTAGSQSAAGTSGTSPVGTNPAPGGNGKGALQAYAKSLLAKYGWAGQWGSFNALEMSEAGWDVHATNPTSGAYGLPQSLPGSKMASAGADWRTNGDTQLQWMMGYIKDRYGSPDKAWSFHQKNNWYASGAYNIDQDQAAQIHKGEMIIPAKQAETVRDAIAAAMTTGVGNAQSSGISGGLSIGSITVNLPQGYSGTQADAKATGKMIVDAIADDDRIKQIQVGQ